MSKGEESAFPSVPKDAPITVDPDGTVRMLGLLTGGLTKREMFAAMAMQGLLAWPGCAMLDVSEDAVSAADALLAALEKKEG